MAIFETFVANLLCHEAVSFLIYGTVFILLLFYIPYWVRQQLDIHYLKFLAKKAREKQQQQETELYESTPLIEHVESLLLREEDEEDDDGEKKGEMELMPIDMLERDSEEKISMLSHHSSRLTHSKQYM